MRKSLSVLVALAMLLAPALTMLCTLAGATADPVMDAPRGISGRGLVNNTDSEPNDATANATLINKSIAIAGSIGYSDASDFFKVKLNSTTLPNRANVSLNFSSNKAGTKANLNLLDPAGFRLDYKQVTAGTLPVNASALAPFAGEYYIEIQWDIANNPTATLNYVLNVSLILFAFSPDGNDRMADAVAIGNGYTATNGLNKLTDVSDFYKFHMVHSTAKTDVLFLEVVPVAGLDPTLEVYSSTGAFLRQINDGATGVTEALYLVASVTDDFYFRVWDNAGNGNYDIVAKAGTGYLDNDNDLANATIVKVGVKMAGNVTDNYDPDDFFAINLTLGEEVTANLSALDYNTTLKMPMLNLWLYNSSSFVKNSTGNNWPSKQVWYEADSPETYYLRVGAAGMSFGAYELKVTVISPPTVLPHASTLTMNEDATAVLDMKTIFQDPQGQPMTYGVAGNMSLRVVFSGTNASINSTTPYWYGYETLTFSATNTLGKTAYATVKVVVNHVNHAPVALQQSFQIELDEDTSYKLTNSFMETKFSDVDNDELSFELGPNANFTYNKTTDSITLRPVKDWNGLAHLKLAASDPSDLNSTTMVDVKVDPVEDSPVLITPIPDVSVQEDSWTVVNLSKYFKDLDGDALTYDGYSEEGQGGIRHIQVSISGSMANISLSPDWFGTENVTFTAKDPSNNTVSATAKVVVSPVNDAPRVSPSYWIVYTQETFVLEDHVGSFDMAKLFVDPEGGKLTFSLVTSGSHLRAALSGNLLTVTPTQDWYGVEKVNVTAQDPLGLKTALEMPVTVINENDPPVLSNMSMSPLKGNEKTNFKFQVTVKDVDGDEPIVSVVIDGKEYRMSKVSGDIKTGALYSYTTKLKGGDHTVSFKANDNQHAANSIATLSSGKIPVQRPLDTSAYLFYAIIIVVLVLLVILAWAAWNRAQRMREFDDSWDDDDDEEEIPGEEE
jgi:hypothetical protein